MEKSERSTIIPTNKYDNINDFTSNVLNVISMISQLHLYSDIEYVTAMDIYIIMKKDPKYAFLTLEYVKEIFEYFKGNGIFINKVQGNDYFAVQLTFCKNI